MQVTSGCRIVLVYNLYVDDTDCVPTPPNQHGASDRLATLAKAEYWCAFRTHCAACAFIAARYWAILCMDSEIENLMILTPGAVARSSYIYWSTNTQIRSLMPSASNCKAEPG